MRTNRAAFAQQMGSDKYIFISTVTDVEAKVIPSMIGCASIYLGECDPTYVEIADVDQMDWHLDHCIIRCEKFPVFKQI
jgi:hypothetical protein